MGRVINSLPVSEPEFSKTSLDEIVDTILDMSKPSTRFVEQAPGQINLFLSMAAVRLAKNYRENDKVDHDGGNF